MNKNHEKVQSNFDSLRTLDDHFESRRDVSPMQGSVHRAEQTSARGGTEQRAETPLAAWSSPLELIDGVHSVPSSLDKSACMCSNSLTTDEMLILVGKSPLAKTLQDIAVRRLAVGGRLCIVISQDGRVAPKEGKSWNNHFSFAFIYVIRVFQSSPQENLFHQPPCRLA